MAVSVATVPASGKIDYPGMLERFYEPDSVTGAACVPLGTNVSNLNFIPLKGADIVEQFLFEYTFTGAFNGYTGTMNVSPWFPYNIVGNLAVPYQTGNLKIGSMDGHQWWLAGLLRGNNKPSQIRPFLDQAAIQTTGYTPETNQVSANNYSPAASTSKTYLFDLSVAPALYLDNFYDLVNIGQNKSSMANWQGVYVSPFLMSSTGRNSIPNTLLNPLFGSTLDNSPFVQSGSLSTAATWTDAGSQVSIKRMGWRQPSSPDAMPPLFNWAHQWYTTRYPLTNSVVQLPLPAEGQLLCIVARMFDPTLSSGRGDAITTANLTQAQVQYGSGIAKFNDTPRDNQRRLFAQHGILPTKGVLVWDMYADTRSNIDAINTYNTAAPQVILNFGSNTPGAGSYVDLSLEYLTLVNAGM